MIRLHDQVHQVLPAAPSTPPSSPVVVAHGDRHRALHAAAPLADFSQSDGPTELSSHGRQSDPPRLPQSRLQRQQRGPGAGGHANGVQGQMEQKNGFSLVCYRFRSGPGKCLEISLRVLSKRGR